jgi:hypothetical protein
MNGEIPNTHELEEKVFAISNEETFQTIALEVYHFQYNNNPVYKTYCDVLAKTPASVTQVRQIPFLPVSFFKSHSIITTDFDPQLVFKSSGTTGMTSSTHYVKKARLYETSFLTCFQKFYGPVEDYCVVGLLPSYLEKGESSLVYMVKRLVEKSGHSESGFYLYDLKKLHKTLEQLESSGQKTILIGVTYALLEFAAAYPGSLKNTIVMETGGMKGRRKELTRAELYEELKKGLGVTEIHSEYGMTELLSQGYSVNGLFRTPPWMKILLRDETDPLSIVDQQTASSGAINVIDLANFYSCSFIATEDIGKIHVDGSFEVLGRMDNTDIRGCSLMVL